MTSKGERYDIFISYDRDLLGSNNSDWVEILAKNLRVQGYKVFFDIWSVIPGESRALQLHEAASSSRSSIIVGAAEKNSSSWLSTEYNLLLQKNLTEKEKYKVLAIIFGGQIPDLPFIGIKACINIEDDSETSYRHAFHKVLCGLKGQPPEDKTFEDELIIPSSFDGPSTVNKASGIKTGAVSLEGNSTWSCVDISLKGDEVVCNNEHGDKIGCMPADALDVFEQNTSDQSIAEMQQLLSSLICEQQPNLQRLRIRTDDPKLAMLPWALAGIEKIVEVSPLTSHFRFGFSTTNLGNPLVVVPDGPLDIMTGSHFRKLESSFGAALNIRGPIPRVISFPRLETELQLHKPDLFYVYASVRKGVEGESEQSLIDEDGQCFTLEQLASWIELAEIRPIVILCLFGEGLQHYPEALVKQCRLLWVQSTARKPIYQTLEKNVLDTFDLLPNSSDLVELINISFSQKGIKNHLWVNGVSPKIKVEDCESIYKLRAALLRILLGREDLKSKLSNDLRDRTKQRKIPCVNYAVTGDEKACPHDVPTQLREKLKLDEVDIIRGLNVVDFHLPMTLDPTCNQQAVIDDLVDGCLVGRGGEIESTFEDELQRSPNLMSDYCIFSLNWRLKIISYVPEELDKWLFAWQETIDQLFIDNIPHKVTLVNAICIETPDAQKANEIQHQVNNQLQKLRAEKGYGFIRIVEGLSKLVEHEIYDFFEDHEHWRKSLKLDENKIDTYEYARWVHKQSDGGEFIEAVNLIWQQYQRDYQDYQNYQQGPV